MADGLPLELLTQIGRYLHQEDLLNYFAMDRLMRSIGSSEYFWRRRFADAGLLFPSARPLPDSPGGFARALVYAYVLTLSMDEALSIVDATLDEHWEGQLGEGEPGEGEPGSSPPGKRRAADPLAADRPQAPAP